MIENKFSRKKEHVGKNYVTYIFDVHGNEFNEIGFVSELILEKNQIKKHFSKFENRAISICRSQEICLDLKQSELFYFYWFNFQNRNPFQNNRIEEAEFAKEFSASWESDYIWVLYKWILINKESTGIS